MSGERLTLDPHARQSADEPLVCVVDDEETVRTGLSRLFRAMGMAVRGFESAGRFLEEPPHRGPCCVVVDMNMPGMGGFEFQHRLAARTEVLVFLTGHGDVPMCAKAMREGAADFLTKPAEPVLLLEAVERALEISRTRIRKHSRQAEADGLIARLSRREYQVMLGVVRGMLNKQIAGELGIAEKTVKIHRGRVMSKTSCVSVPDLVRLVQCSRAADLAPTPA